MENASLVTDVGGPQALFQKFLAEGRFMIQRSRGTGEYVFYPKVSTPSGQLDLEWVEASGNATVYAITVDRRLDGAFNVALVDLDEGPRMMTTIVDCEFAPIGSRVRARIEGGESPRVVFELGGA